MPLDLSGNGILSGVDIAGSGLGKILQVVRATDVTQRNTTSTTMVDANLSVTITPQKSDSAVLLVVSNTPAVTGTNNYVQQTITDASNNSISGAELVTMGDASSSAIQVQTTFFAWATPATTSAVTYKLRFKINSSGTARLYNNENTGQMLAIEVSA